MNLSKMWQSLSSRKGMNDEAGQEEVKNSRISILPETLGKSQNQVMWNMDAMLFFLLKLSFKEFKFIKYSEFQT